MSKIIREIKYSTDAFITIEDMIFSTALQQRFNSSSRLLQQIALYMEQSWGSVEEVLKDFALMLMNTSFSEHSIFKSIYCFLI